MFLLSKKSLQEETVSSSPVETSSGKIGVRLNFFDRGFSQNQSDRLSTCLSPFLVDTVNGLKISGISAPEGTPGAGKSFQHQQIYDTTKARTELGIQFRDKATTAADTLEDFKQKGWVKA